MRPDQERAAMRQAGLVPIPLEIAPGSGCPGGVVDKGPRAGKPVPMCDTCSRIGGRDLAPAVRVVNGEPRCPNFHGSESAGVGAGAAPLGVPAAHPLKVGRS